MKKATFKNYYIFWKSLDFEEKFLRIFFFLLAYGCVHQLVRLPVYFKESAKDKLDLCDSKVSDNSQRIDSIVKELSKMDGKIHDHQHAKKGWFR